MKHDVKYNGGPSRTHPTRSVDYMLVTIDGVELYAEKLYNEDEPEPDDNDTATYDGLKAEIIEQAKARGIDPDRLWFEYDC